MKNYFKKVVIACAFVFFTIASIGASVHASDNEIRTVGTKWVVKSVMQDENKYTGAISNRDVMASIEVPSDAYVVKVKKELVTSYWNYNRVLIVYEYQSSLGFH